MRTKRKPIVRHLLASLTPEHPDDAKPCHTAVAFARPPEADVRAALKALDRADTVNQQARAQLTRLLPDTSLNK